MNHILEVDSIELEFNSRKILSDIYLKCETGKITGLLGRNGEGKTCLMNIITGSLEPQSKSIRFDSKMILNPLQKTELALYLPQFNFIPKFLTLKKIFSDFNINFNEFATNFPQFKENYLSRIDSLSGGEKRLVEVYIIIKSKTQFLILDEPFSHIMPLHIEVIKEILHKEKLTKGILITDHMHRHITQISDYLYLLTNRKTHLTKSAQDLVTLGYTRA